MSKNTKNKVKKVKDKIKDDKFINWAVYSKLPAFEIVVYYVVWISGMLYLLYSVYLVSNDYREINDRLIDGWSYIGLERDTSDSILELLYNTILYIVFYGILHFVLAELLKYFCKKALSYYYFAFTMVLIIFHVSYKMGLFLIVQFLMSVIMVHYGDTFCVWYHGLVTIISIYLPTNNLLQLCNVQNEMLVPLFQNTLIWNSLRHLSFALYMKHTNNNYSIKYNDLINYLGYYFYFPTLCLGPLILYKDFKRVYKIRYNSNISRRFPKFLISIIRSVGFLYLAIFLLHYLHFGLLQHIEVLHVSYPAFHGFYWCFGFLFLSKYLVVYGMAGSAAKAERIKTSNPPKCIGRITLYSEMWKNFDQSMYWFKKKHIFKAFQGDSKSKIKRAIASFLCFSFVIIWHGGRPEIIIWATINYTEVALENIAKFIIKFKVFRKIINEHHHIGSNSVRRMTALLSVPLFCLSTISQYFLFSNYYSVQLLIKKMKEESYFTNGMILAAVYCGCQVSIEVKRRELLRQKGKNRKVKIE